MSSLSEEEADNVRSVECCASKKRKTTGRMTEVSKKLGASSNALGPNCQCKQYQCFKLVPGAKKTRISREFNQPADHNKQSMYLGGLITVPPVFRRGSRGASDNESLSHSASYSYIVRVRNGRGRLLD
ncbi:hypothetical protein JTB14_037493 [Gonioctena quinquepunctata]|nr:hypothetical protein JTB14_037493 [Gonioctena quinquepunctata]